MMQRLIIVVRRRKNAILVRPGEIFCVRVESHVKFINPSNFRRGALSRYRVALKFAQFLSFSRKSPSRARARYTSTYLPSRLCFYFDN